MPKIVDVEIDADMDGGKIVFEMQQNNHYTEMLVFNKSKDGIKGNDYYEIKFTLDDNTGKGLKFDSKNPIYISRGSRKHVPKCPTGGNVGSSQDFSVAANTGKTLTVRNDDMDDCLYKFALNFEDSAGNKHMFDPIFGNQNGGVRFLDGALMATGLLCGAAGGAAATALSSPAMATPFLMAAAIGAIVGIVVALIAGMVGSRRSIEAYD